MDNTEKLATYGTQDEDKQNIDMQRYFFRISSNYHSTKIIHRALAHPHPHTHTHRFRY